VLDHAAFACSALATARLAGPADVVIAETPPLFTAAAGALYASRKRAALVVNVADRWPASAVELGALRNTPAIAAAEALERWIYRRADMITSPTEGIAKSLGSLPEGAGKSHRLWPVVDVSRFSLPAPPDAPRGPLRVLYAGTVGLAHGLEVLVEASRLAGPDVVRTTIAGGGAELNRIRVAAARVANVELLGVVAADRVPSLYAQADASAVLLRDLPLFRGALPTKMLEAMAAGRPLLLSARGEAERLVARAGAGIVVAPEDAEALAKAIRRLHANPALRRSLGDSGRAFAEAEFGADRAAAAWSAALEDALAAYRRRRKPICASC
jgi:glycosyltransferase involved in cell wall biosynthesis